MSAVAPQPAEANRAPSDESAQFRIVLTTHPLQRVGAFALARLVRATPAELSPEDFRAAMDILTRDVVRACVKGSKAPDGFWQKVSLSFFPNSPMNHPGRYKGKNEQGGPKTDADVKEAARRWLRPPDPEKQPDADCALCGRPSAGWYGKRDMPLAESDAYRNTTPPGHKGTALCYPCLCSFYALPYGSELTGGSSTILHSWDERFTQHTVARRTSVNLAAAATGIAPERPHTREVVALLALRSYKEPVRAGVDLMVFNNNNQDQVLERHHLDQPLAEWLGSRRGAGPGFTALVRAHRTKTTAGYVALARNAFRAPERIPGVILRRLLRTAGLPGWQEERRSLTALLDSFVEKVMQVQKTDRDEIRAVARKLAHQLRDEESWGALKQLRMRVRQPVGLRRWLSDAGIHWACLDPNSKDNAIKREYPGPLVSEHAFLLLFDPAPGARSWLHRELLLVDVLAELDALGWYLTGEQEKEAEAELRDERNADDDKYIEEEKNEENR